MIGRLLRYIHMPNEDVEQYAQETIDLFVSKFGEEKLPMLFKTKIDEYTYWIGSILKGNFKHDEARFYGSVSFNVVKCLIKMKCCPYLDMVDRLEKVFNNFAPVIHDTEYYCNTHRYNDIKSKYDNNVRDLTRLFHGELMKEHCLVGIVEKAREIFTIVYHIEEYIVDDFDNYIFERKEC